MGREGVTKRPLNGTVGFQHKKYRTKGTQDEYLCSCTFCLGDPPAVVESEGSEVEFSPTPGAHTWAMLQGLLAGSRRV